MHSVSPIILVGLSCFRIDVCTTGSIFDDNNSETLKIYGCFEMISTSIKILFVEIIIFTLVGINTGGLRRH